MEKRPESGWNRRRFLSAVPCLVVGGSLVDLMQEQSENKNDGSLLSAPFTKKEEKIIKHSVMAQDILQFPGNGYSCAESSLVVGLRYLEQPESCVNAAAAFGGGIGRGDLCGLLTGGLMALGFYASVKHPERSAMKDFIRPVIDTYWKWFESMAPIHCEDLRFHCRDRDKFLRMCQRTALRLEQLMKTA